MSDHSGPDGVPERPLVLVADDDPDILDLVRRSLERSGHEVSTAPDGARALELAIHRPPQLAVLDVSMPGLDGLELTRRLRAADATRTMPIIILTAGAQDSDRASSLEAGADLHVKKPFSPRELVSNVQELLGRRRA